MIKNVSARLCFDFSFLFLISFLIHFYFLFYFHDKRIYSLCQNTTTRICEYIASVLRCEYTASVQHTTWLHVYMQNVFRWMHVCVSENYHRNSSDTSRCTHNHKMQQYLQNGSSINIKSCSQCKHKIVTCKIYPQHDHSAQYSMAYM